MDAPPPERTQHVEQALNELRPKACTKPASADDDPIESFTDFDVAWLAPKRSTTDVSDSQASTVDTQSTTNSQETRSDDVADVEAKGSPGEKKRKADDDAPTPASEDPVVALLAADEAPLTREPSSDTKPEGVALDATELFGSFQPPAGDALNVEHLFGTFGASAPFVTPLPNMPTGAMPKVSLEPDEAPDPAVLKKVGKCHNCSQEGHWASDCKFILSKMQASRETKCALCPFVIKTNQDTIVKLGCGPFTYQWVHRACAMQHLATLGWKA